MAGPVRFELTMGFPTPVLQVWRLRYDATGVYHAPGTLKEMATELGLTHEALYRALATLERQKHISRADGGLRIMRNRRNDPVQTPESPE